MRLLVNFSNLFQDVSLMKEYFGLSCSYEDMSPLIIPRGYTKDFIDGKISIAGQLEKLHTAYDNLAQTSDLVLLEGTGHTGVGSVVNLNNAQVAKHLGADMILVANGGLGSAYDELSLNYQMCKEHGVKVCGVILNKVIADKVEMVHHYFERLLKPWGVPLLGVVPDEEYLGRPSFMDLEKIFGTKLIGGYEQRASSHHFSTEDTLMVATDLNYFLRKLQELPEHPLVVTHQTRNDAFLGLLAHLKALQADGLEFGGGLVITGRQRGGLNEYVEDMLVAQVSIPKIPIPGPAFTLLTPWCRWLRICPR